MDGLKGNLKIANKLGISIENRRLGMDILEDKIKKDIDDVLGLHDEDGTYYYALTRVKSAFNVGTMTLDDFVEVDEDLVDDIYQAIKPYMKVTVNTPPLPESEYIKLLQNQINTLQLEIYRLTNHPQWRL